MGFRNSSAALVANLRRHLYRLPRWRLESNRARPTEVDREFDQGEPWLDPVACERIGELLGEARANRMHFGQASVRDGDICFSTPQDGSRTPGGARWLACHGANGPANS
jgi:hypothetical protein